MDLILTVAFGAALAGFVQGLSGFGFGLTAMALWAWTLEPKLAASLSLFGSLTGQTIAAVTVRRGWDFKALLPFVLGGLAALGLAACAEGPISPDTPSSLAVGDKPAPTPTAAVGRIVICKTGNVAGSFDVTRVAIGASTGAVSGLNTAIAVNTCYEVANDQGGTGVGSSVTIDEDPGSRCAFSALRVSTTRVARSAMTP